jgi:hypothetical protein
MSLKLPSGGPIVAFPKVGCGPHPHKYTGSAEVDYSNATDHRHPFGPL